VIVLYILALLAVVQGVIALADGIRAARYMREYRPLGPTHKPRIVVFCPCKGIDPGFEQNIRSILDQDYPDFHPVFVVESTSDPAYSALTRMAAPAVLIAGQATGCGQKVHNLRYAVEHAGANNDVYVFCDSDARFPRHWLHSLTAPLSESESIVATGYRWYVVSHFQLSTLLRSAWNATVVSMLGGHGRNFAWGGSMAMRRETFERIHVLDEWKGSVSDDYSVTGAARKHGAKIVFVPECLIPSYGDCSFGEMLEFTTRQILITRVYHPRLWRIGFFAQTIFCLTFLWLLAVLPGNPSAAVLWIVIFGLAGAKSAVRHRAVSEVLRDPSLSRFGWFYILFSPVVALIYEYNMVRSALGRTIEWRQIHYTLISANETRVRR
jgi:cellulose synthase/poly-beta-1,6-N-acetylglucosamine synthase-like glycosyltransferase